MPSARMTGRPSGKKERGEREISGSARPPMRRRKGRASMLKLLGGNQRGRGIALLLFEAKGGEKRETPMQEKIRNRAEKEKEKKKIGLGPPRPRRSNEKRKNHATESLDSLRGVRKKKGEKNTGINAVLYA